MHPLHVESVAWVAERKDVLSALLRHARRSSPTAATRAARRAAPPRGVALFAAASLLAKPMLVTLPFVLLLLLDFGRWGGCAPPPGGARCWKKPLSSPWGCSPAAPRIQAQASVAAFSEYPAGARLANAVVSCGRHVLATLAPAGLAVFYPYPRQPPAAGTVLVAALFLAAATFLALRGWRRRPWLACGWLWFLLALSPTIGIVQVGEQALADRYSYVPAVGLAVAAAWGLGGLAGRLPTVRPLAAAACALAAFSLMSARQVGRWRDDHTLFSHAARAVPGNWVAHFQLGSLAQRGGRDAEAVAHYGAAVAARPGLSEALNNIGTILERQGSPAEAARWYRAAVRRTHGTSRPATTSSGSWQGRVAPAPARREGGRLEDRVDEGRDGRDLGQQDEHGHQQEDDDERRQHELPAFHHERREVPQEPEPVHGYLPGRCAAIHAAAARCGAGCRSRAR